MTVGNCGIIRRMYDLLLLKMYLRNIYIANLKNDEIKMKNLMPYVKWLVKKTPVENPAQYENIYQNEAIKSFADKRVFFFFKVGGSQARRISRIAAEDKYTKPSTSKFSSLHTCLDLTRKGDTLRTWAGLHEELHTMYPKTLATFSGTAALTVGITLAKILIALGEKGLQYLHER